MLLQGVLRTQCGARRGAETGDAARWVAAGAWRWGPQIVLKVLSKSRSGAVSYVGHVRLMLNEVYPRCLPADLISLPPAADAVISKDADTRILLATWWPIDHRAPQSAALYSGGGGADCRVFKWDVASGNILRSYPRRAVSRDTREGHGSAVTGLVEADAYGVRRLFSASHDGTVHRPPYSRIFRPTLALAPDSSQFSLQFAAHP